MSAMYGGSSSYQYPQGSFRPNNNQPLNYGYYPTTQTYSAPPPTYIERSSVIPASPLSPNRPAQSNTTTYTSEFSIPSSLNVERRATNPALTLPANRAQYNVSSAQNVSIPPSLYVERPSKNPVPMAQYNQPQYIESNNSALGYQNARAVQAQTSGMYHQSNAGTPSRNVNPVLKANPSPQPLSQYAINGRENVLVKKELRSEVDDSPIINPSAFQALNLGDKRAPTKSISKDNDSGIDTRPISNLDAVTQLEKRRQQQLEKNNRLRGDDGSGSGIDQRSIVDVNAFRYIEAKANKNNRQQGQDNDSGIDTRPITNPDAFKYLEAKRERKPSKPIDESSIDTRPIINPDAFKYLEKRRTNTRKANDDSGIDCKPIVDPAAFRYLEQRTQSVSRDIESGVDTKPIVNPSAFQFIEKKDPPRPEVAESTVDTRPIVNPKAFRWLERRNPRHIVNKDPDVDERSYVNPQAFQNLDRRPPKKSDVCESEIDTRSYILDRNPNALAHLERKPSNQMVNTIESGIDERSFVNPNAFKYLEGSSDDKSRVSVHSSAGPPIDTKSYVKPDAFRHLEKGDTGTKNNNGDDSVRVDERSYVPPSAFRHLEFTGDNTNPAPANNFSTYGQTDF